MGPLFRQSNASLSVRDSASRRQAHLSQDMRPGAMSDVRAPCSTPSTKTRLSRAARPDGLICRDTVDFQSADPRCDSAHASATTSQWTPHPPRTPMGTKIARTKAQSSFSSKIWTEAASTRDSSICNEMAALEAMIQD